MKAERRRSKGCLTTRKVFAERRNLSLSTFFHFKVKILKNVANLDFDGGEVASS